MNKLIRPWSSGLLYLALIALLASCGKATPKPPIDERHNKGHDHPSIAELTLTAGTLKADKTFSSETTLDDVTLTSESIQRIGLDNRSGQIIYIKDPGYVEKFSVESTLRNPQRVYLLQIDYKNVSGQLMNDQLTSDEQINRHQHFFKEVDSYINGSPDYIKTETLLSYRYAYCDVFSQVKNPVGLKGLIQFVKPDEVDKNQSKTLRMVITLAHFYNTKFTAPGVVRPFFSALTPGADTDINFSIDFVINAH